MKVVFSERQDDHNPRSYLSSGASVPNPEVPERAARLLQAALNYGLQLEVPTDYGIAPLEAVHSSRYLKFLKNIYTRWSRIPGASEEVLPNVHPDRRNGSYPKSAVGHVGYHIYDASCPIAAGTWEGARWSANSAVHAAQLVLNGERTCYALARPPGHHAGSDLVGGFCFLNNSAIAAQVLRSAHERVAILDVDVHHGNGTQDIFYGRGDVLTVSIHADPVRFYPFYWGYADETGEGAGENANCNYPLPRGTVDKDYLPVLDEALARIDAFAPTALVVALGLDAFEGDPYQGFGITTGGFAQIAARIATLGLPTLLVQEGGYLCDELGDNLESFLRGFAG
ncbi:MAG: histone deacetylase family protein [Woeseia sp.]|nr:histone deacetylase family protein [Woeseia sp.]